MLVPMAVDHQELELEMTEERALVMLPPLKHSLDQSYKQMTQEGWALPPLAQAPRLRRPPPLPKEKAGLLAKSLD